MVVSVLTRCALLQSVCDLKAAQMNVQCSLIQELMLDKFELGYNATEVTKKIYYAKDEGAVDRSCNSGALQIQTKP